MSLRDAMRDSAVPYLGPGEPVQAVIGAQTASQWLAAITGIFVFLGFNLTFMSQFIMGSRGMPRRYYDYLPQFEPFHRVSTVGSWILAFGLFLTAYTLLEALWKGKKAPRNPWGSASYEWMTDSPPCVINYHSPPVITRGPYDYHLATPEELATGWDEVSSNEKV